MAIAWWKNRRLERVFLLLAGIILSLLFLDLYQKEQRNFGEVPQRLKDGTMVNLNAGNPEQQIVGLLQKGFYFSDNRDILFAGKAVGRGFSTDDAPLDNIGELNKRRFQVNAADAYIQGGESYRKRAKLSRALIGYTYEDSLLYEQEAKSPAPMPATADLAMGRYGISGSIQTREGESVANVLVRLGMVIPDDSLYGKEIQEELRFVTERTGAVRKIYAVDSGGGRQLQTVIAYARTDGAGKFRFDRLSGGKAFEVLPLQPGFEFGASKGVQELDENTAFTFLRSPHSLRLFATRDFNNLKKERSLIVRMPDEVNYWFLIIGVCFLLSFLVVHLLLTFRFPCADQLLLPVLMLLTGLSFLTLLSLQDPLRDRFLGRSTFYYFEAGMACICLLLLFDFRLFTADSGLYRLFVFRGTRKAAAGWPWAIAAAGLLVLTLLFGTGPEGSGVKVNLAGFQPSELVKFLLIFFLAGFFTANEKFISEYTHWQRRWTFFYTALLAILATIFLFLLLGDLGPAMVCCFTFILLFSFSRGDFIYAVGSVLLYILAIWLLENLWLATGLVLILTLIASFFIRKGLCESSVMILVVIAGFLLLDKLPLLARLVPGPIQRLTDRKAIWQNPWDNEVFGGDHIANAVWGMTSGGVTGQGIGEGFAKTIPEAHTDMILPSMGEEFGLGGILCTFILFLIYLHRAIIIGRHTGRSFLFYLCAGIGIATFVQFLLIAGGSIGALPLSGVSLPFMSYGGSSLIANMVAAGILLSVSNVEGSPVQMKYISRQHDTNLVPALAAACVGILLLGISVSRYLFNSTKWVVQPALVADRSGARIFSYNPRIAILVKRLQAGTLYDRKGLILATSQPGLIAKQQNSLAGAGLDPARLALIMHQRQDRYYPFAEQMFFWIGDMNTGLFMGGTNGYFAEYEHLADLRGFPAPERAFKVTASQFRPARFLPPRQTDMTVMKRDFAALAPLLLAGINSREVDSFKKQNRDVQMTLDAALQTELQQVLSTGDSLKDSRISVVVMDASNGDVLASAAYPMPDVEHTEQLLLTAAEQNRLPYWITTSDIGFTHATQPGSTAKLATALAAFNKLGPAAARKVIIVRPGDRIRTGGYEPDEAGAITIEQGIVRSNNPFFIRLANEEHLEEFMATIYMQVGMFLHGVGGYFFAGDLANAGRQQAWMEFWRKTEFQSRKSYNPNDIFRTRGRGISGMAWGQGELVSTPAALARLVSGIANKGTMLPNRYVLRIADSVLPPGKGIAIAKDSQYAALMTGYMKKQSAPKFSKLGMYVAGKTGTPERVVHNEHINDGWYVFFAPKGNGPGYLVTCVRIERCKGSSVAVKLAGDKVIPVLKARGYIKGFEGTAAPAGTGPAKKQPQATPETGDRQVKNPPASPHTEETTEPATNGTQQP